MDINTAKTKRKKRKNHIPCAFVQVAKLVICPEAEICHIALEAYQQVDTGLQKQKYMIM